MLDLKLNRGEAAQEAKIAIVVRWGDISLATQVHEARLVAQRNKKQSIFYLFQLYSIVADLE